ncbi:MAG: nicotinamide riboside transporter PnuC [Paludibacter sp.]|jgi:nicotinamide mononucleotide transporter|nr:nicotinamide riboside transporter PnuC [Paludibacter sp.]
MNPLEIVAVVFTFTSILLAVKEKILTFPLAIIGTLLFTYIFFTQRVYASASLQIVFLSFNIFGWWRWLHPKKEEAKADNTLSVSKLRKSELLITLTITGILYIILVYLISHLHTWFPNVFQEARYVWIDNFILAASIVGQYLMAVKKIENWAWWLAVDVIAAPFYFFTVGWLTGLMYLAFIATGILGLIGWNKSMQQSKKQ